MHSAQGRRRNTFRSGTPDKIAELEKSNDELRGALIACGRELRRLPLSKRKTRVLEAMRRTLREARAVRKGQHSALTTNAASVGD
jgi:DNA topoisomerase VI subunit B